MKKYLFLILILASWALGGLCLAEQSPAELPVLNLPQIKSQTGVLDLGDFSGGLNLKDYPTQVKNNQATELQNAWWDKGGALGRRRGYTHFTIIDDSTTGINGIFRYYKQNDDRYLMVGGDTALYYVQDDADTFVKIRGAISSGGEFYFSNYNDKVYVTNENTIPLIYDGSELEYLGIADSSSRGVLWGSPSQCSLGVLDKSKGWDTDEWVGYVVKIINQTLDDTIWGFVVRNSSNHLLTRNRASAVVGYGLPAWTSAHSLTYYIYSWYQRGSAIYQTDVDGLVDTLGCWRRVGNYDSLALCLDTLLYRQGIVIKFLTGEATGYFEYIYRQYGDSSFLISHNYFPEIAVGDSFELYQLNFWKSKYNTIFRNRLVLASDSINDNVVYYSEISEPDNFPSDNKFTTFTPDGDVITGIMSLYNDQRGVRASPKDRLLIFKQNNVMATDDNFEPYVIATGVGATAPRSIVNVEGRFIGFAHTTGYYSTDGNGVKDTALSYLIKPFWDNINPLAIDQVACGYYDRHIVCSVPYDDATENDTCLIYNIDNKSWSGANISASVFANQWGLEDTIKFLWGSPDGGFINRYGVSNFDDGDSITLTYKSKEFDLDDLSQRKTFRNMLIAYDMTSPIILALDFYINFGASAIWSTSFTDSGKDIKRVNISPIVVGKTLSWGLSSKDPDITIGNVKINYQALGGY